MKSIFITSLLLSLFCSIASAQTFSSSNKQVSLIELYTSEGCSSCPPADKWLNNLTRKRGLWSEFIPIAFHVDYWDYIGWKDPFADPQYSQRQRQYSRDANLSSVYTPGMVLNGVEWTSWRRHSNSNLTSHKSTGKLTIELNNDTLDARYQATSDQTTDLVLNIAILGFDLESNINAGENHGKTFHHDFVVLGYHRVAMRLSDDGLYTVATTDLPQTHITADKTALAVWINDSADLAPLQATGGWLN